MRAKEVFEKLNRVNDGNRTLFESIVAPEVLSALQDWIKNSGKGILIGGNAMSYYGKPRATMDVDILFMNNEQVPSEVNGFKRIRPSAYQHTDTHVEIETVTPELVGISADLVRAVYETANEIDGYRVASPSGLIALKLQRLKNNDIGDIVQMINTGSVDLSPFPLSEKNLEDFKEIQERFV